MCHGLTVWLPSGAGVSAGGRGVWSSVAPRCMEVPEACQGGWDLLRWAMSPEQGEALPVCGGL